MSKQSSQLILLRHGQSVWNAKNLFTGWVDVPLSPQGVEEALAAGEQIKEIPIEDDNAFMIETKEVYKKLIAQRNLPLHVIADLNKVISP